MLKPRKLSPELGQLRLGRFHSAASVKEPIDLIHEASKGSDVAMQTRQDSESPLIGGTEAVRKFCPGIAQVVQRSAATVVSVTPSSASGTLPAAIIARADLDRRLWKFFERGNFFRMDQQLFEHTPNPLLKSSLHSALAFDTLPYSRLCFPLFMLQCRSIKRKRILA